MELQKAIEAVYAKVDEMNSLALDNAETGEDFIKVDVSIDGICHFRFQESIGGTYQAYVNITAAETYLNGLIMGLYINFF